MSFATFKMSFGIFFKMSFGRNAQKKPALGLASGSVSHIEAHLKALDEGALEAPFDSKCDIQFNLNVPEPAGPCNCYGNDDVNCHSMNNLSLLPDM